MFGALTSSHEGSEGENAAKEERRAGVAKKKLEIGRMLGVSKKRRAMRPYATVK